MIRVVYDTNIVVSAALKPGSISAFLLALALEQQVRLCLSPPIWEEYRAVLKRPKFRLSAKAVERMLQDLHRAALLVIPPSGLVLRRTSRITASWNALTRPERRILSPAIHDTFPSPRFRGYGFWGRPHLPRSMLPSKDSNNTREQCASLLLRLSVKNPRCHVHERPELLGSTFPSLREVADDRRHPGNPALLPAPDGNACTPSLRRALPCRETAAAESASLGEVGQSQVTPLPLPDRGV